MAKLSKKSADELVDLTLLGDLEAADELRQRLSGGPSHAMSNPMSATNAGRRMRGSLNGPTVQRDGRKAANPRRDPSMVALSTTKLVALAQANDTAAIEELRIRDRDRDGVKLAWKQQRGDKPPGAAMGRATQKFATGQGLLRPRWQHATQGARTNGIFGDFSGDED